MGATEASLTRSTSQSIPAVVKVPHYDHRGSEGLLGMPSETASFATCSTYNAAPDDAVADELVTDRSNDEKTENSDSNRHEASALQKLGTVSAVSLAVTPIATLGIFAFLAYLWFGNSTYTVWHRFMVYGWVTRAISVSALGMRFATGIQAGMAVAMLAALMMEDHGSVLLRSAAAMSIMRSKMAAPHNLLSQTFSSWEEIKKTPPTYLASMVVLLTTTTLIQFSSTAMLSDLRLGLLPGVPITTSVLYDFDNALTGNYDWGLIKRSNWQREPPSFPTFAEYSHPPQIQEGIDDTGTILRAFLPIQSVQDRAMVRNYSGQAMVLDSRVACQAPLIHNLTLTSQPCPMEMASCFTVSGEYSPSKSMLGLITPDMPVGFGSGITGYGGTIMAITDGLYQDIAICQTALDCTGSSCPAFGPGNPTGAVISEFRNITLPPQRSNESELSWWGGAYLVFWVESPLDVDIPDDMPLTGVSSGTSGVWTNVTVSNSSGVVLATANFSLCYSTFDAARLDVDMFSHSSRIEPAITTYNYFPSHPSKQPKYGLESVYRQLGISTEPLTPDDRGILTLKQRKSWFPSTIDSVPWVVESAGIGFGAWSDTGEASAFLAPGLNSYILLGSRFTVAPDPILTQLFGEILARTRSVARTMSEMIFTTSRMAYYDQSPGFREGTNATITSFVTVLFPQSSVGFAAVVTVVSIHTIHTLIITACFITRSHLTKLGNSWQIIAQLVTPRTERILQAATMETDDEICTRLKCEGQYSTTIELVELMTSDVEEQSATSPTCGIRKVNKDSAAPHGRDE